MVGFFIAIHVVRFRGSGQICAEKILDYRGAFLLTYMIAAWTFFGVSCIGIIAYALVKRHK